jgi:hypothetical protein
LFAQGICCFKKAIGTLAKLLEILPYLGIYPGTGKKKQ